MDVFGNASDWVLRRLFKVFLKKNLSKYVATEFDVDQLGVDISGSLELRECLLDTTYLNEQLGNSPFEVESALLGRVNVTLFPPGILVEDAVVTVRQKESLAGAPAGVLPVVGSRSPDSKATPPSIDAAESQEAFYTALGDGVELISCWVKGLMQRVEVKGKGLVLRAKLAEDYELTVNLDEAAFQGTDQPDAGQDAEAAGDVEIKTLSFSGLAIQLAAGVSLGDSTPVNVLASLSGEGGGCNGSVGITWPKNVDLQQGGTLEVRVALGGVHTWSSPAIIPAVFAILETVAHATDEVETPSNDGSTWGAPHPAAQPMTMSLMAADPTSARHIIEALMLPDGERLLEEELTHLQESTTARAAAEEDEVEEFFDAVSEFMSQSMLSNASTMFSSFFSEAELLDSAAASQEGAAALHESPDVVSLSVKFSMGISSLDFCLADLSTQFESDSWHLRFSVRKLAAIHQGQGLNLTQLSLSCEAVEICELFVPAPDSYSKRKASQCLGLMAMLSPQLSCPGWFQEETPLSDTIHQLQRLGRERSLAIDHYEVLPVLALKGGGGQPALGVVLNRMYTSREMPRKLDLSIVFEGAAVWLDVQLLERLQRIATSITLDGLPARQTEALPSAGSNAFRASLYTSAIAACCFWPTQSIEAIALEFNSGLSSARLFSGFMKGDNAWSLSPDADRATVSFGGEARKLLLAAEGASIYHALGVEDMEEPFHIQRMASAEGLVVTCLPRAAWSLDDLPVGMVEVRDAMAPSSSGSLPFGGLDVEIAARLSISFDTSLLSSVASFGSYMASLSRPTTHPEALRIGIRSLDISLGNITNLAGREVLFMRISQPGDMVLSACSLLDITARNTRTGSVFLQTCSKEPAFAFNSTKRPSSTDNKLETHMHVRLQDLVLIEDFSSETPFWADFLSLGGESQPPSASGSAPEAFSMDFDASNLVVMDNPLHLYPRPAAGLVVDALQVTQRGSNTSAQLLGCSAFVRGSALDENFQPTGNLKSWLEAKSAIFFAYEDSLIFDQSISLEENGVLRSSITTHFLNLQFSKESSVMLKGLLLHHSLDDNANHSCDAGAIEEENVGRSARNAFDWILQPSMSSGSPAGSWFGEDNSSSQLSSGRCASPEGDGVLFAESGIMAAYIEEYVPEPPAYESYHGFSLDFGGEAKPGNAVHLNFGKVVISLTDTFAVPGLDTLEGSFEIQINDVRLNWSDFSSEPISELSHHIGGSVGKVSMRHNIHPLSAMSMPWRVALKCPYLGPEAPALSSVVEAAKNSDGQFEWHVRVKLSPLSLQTDQFSLAFLREFFSFVNLDSWQFVDDDDDDLLAPAAPTTVAVQHAHIHGFPLVVSYKPCRIDIAALRQGNLAEVLNVVPEWKASLWIKELKLDGLESFSSLSTVAFARWIEDIVACQMQKFAVNLPGVGSVCRVGNVARRFVALPPSASRKELKRQLHRAVVSLARAVASESRGFPRAMAEAWSSRR